MTDYDIPKLPTGWEWRSGNRSDSYYTHWFGTTFRMGGKLAGVHGLGGYDGELYWDEGGDHHVQIYPVTAINDNGEARISEYPEAFGSYDSEQEAIDAIPDLIAGLEDDE